MFQKITQCIRCRPWLSAVIKYCKNKLKGIDRGSKRRE